MEAFFASEMRTRAVAVFRRPTASVYVFSLAMVIYSELVELFVNNQTLHARGAKSIARQHAHNGAAYRLSDSASLGKR